MNWNNLTKEERGRYMRLQMSAGNGGVGRNPYLPDDSAECKSCGQPILWTGWCKDCYQEWKQLRDKLTSELVQQENRE